MRRPLFFACISLLLVGLLGPTAPLLAQAAAPEIRFVADVAYKTGDALSDYEKSRCKLDWYLPATAENFPTLVWFHGGGLTGGAKDEPFTAKIGRRLAEAGIAVVTVNYRLSPRATYPAYLDDAAAAFAWIRTHVAEQGGDPAKVFVGGHSAGGYLTAMLGLDERLLRPYGLTTKAIAGLLPISGQMMTHFTVRAERGIADQNVITADEAAPINHLHKITPPWLILFADQDWPARREENLYFAAALRATGNKLIQTQQIDDRTHGSIAGNISNPGDPAAEAIIRFIADTSGAPKN